MNKTTFLDRDGVIIQEPPHYIYRPDQLHFIPGSIEAIKLLNENDFLVVIVTNQAGVAYGHYSENDVLVFHKLMKRKLEKKNAKIDAIYYCPHHPESKIEKYRVDCNCRKPKSGMLQKAEKDLNIDFKKSFMVGDKISDIEAGRSVGCKTVMVLTGHGREESKIKNIGYDFITNDLYHAIEHILYKEV